MNDITKCKKAYGEWFYTKGEGQVNYYDITTALPTDELTEPEKVLDDLERYGVDMPDNYEHNVELINKLARIQEEQENEYLRWTKKIQTTIKQQKWPIPKRLTCYFFIFINQQGKEITLIELQKMVHACCPLQRDRKAILQRASEMMLTNNQKLRLTNRVVAELINRSSNQVSNYRREIQNELGELLKELSEAPARDWPNNS
jgi:hypothetical protein